jgi:tetratricopeptide (TPR) repeat protein
VDPLPFFRRGLRDLEKAAALAPNDMLVQNNLGLGYHTRFLFHPEGQGSRDPWGRRALRTFDETLVKFPEEWSLLGNKALVLASMGRREEAIQYYRRAIAAAGNTPTPFDAPLRELLGAREAPKPEKTEFSLFRLSRAEQAFARGDLLAAQLLLEKSLPADPAAVPAEHRGPASRGYVTLARILVRLATAKTPRVPRKTAHAMLGAAEVQLEKAVHLGFPPARLNALEDLSPLRSSPRWGKWGNAKKGD